MTEQKPRRGRPPKALDGRRRHNMTFRVRDRLRDILFEAALSNGRSESEEIEYRLEMSFDREAVVRAVMDEEDKRAEQAFRQTIFALSGPMGRPLDS